MVFGYSFIDPLVVLALAALSGYLLFRDPRRLLGWIPATLTLYFFVPLVTLLSIGQVVTLMLTGRMALNTRIHVSRQSVSALAVMACCFMVSIFIALIEGGELERIGLRALFYLGLLAIFSFCYEFGASQNSYEILIKGLSILGIVLAIYGIYQIVAVYTGLPLRGIVRGTRGAQIAIEAGILRINSLASEPKRLGFVMLICALACFEWARLHRRKSTGLKRWGAFVLGTSFLTLSGSYFFAIFIFVVVLIFIFPSRATKFAVLAACAVIVMSLFPETRIAESFSSAYERRAQEVEIGLDGTRVYRQEFFALDYLGENPASIIAGVGIGQYYGVLNRAYWPGVGIGEDGETLVPMNSSLLEVLFDLSGVFVVIFYSSLGILIWRLRCIGERFICLALLFSAIQSLTIQTLPFIAMLAGVGTARLLLYRSSQKTKAVVAI
jgi:hypothetical protein